MTDLPSMSPDHLFAFDVRAGGLIQSHMKGEGSVFSVPAIAKVQISTTSYPRFGPSSHVHGNLARIKVVIWYRIVRCGIFHSPSD
jgi:hypothetical protein